MKATLEFNLPDDNQEHMNAVHAQSMASFITATFDKLRNELKYNPSNHSDETLNVIEQLRDNLLEDIEERNLQHIFEV